jgi:heme exporter protein D
VLNFGKATEIVVGCWLNVAMSYIFLKTLLNESVILRAGDGLSRLSQRHRAQQKRERRADTRCVTKPYVKWAFNHQKKRRRKNRQRSYCNVLQEGASIIMAKRGYLL